MARPSASYYARRVRSTAWRRGLGGSQPYLVFAIILTGFRLLRRIANPKPTVVYRHKLAPGETWQITARSAKPR